MLCANITEYLKKSKCNSSLECHYGRGLLPNSKVLFSYNFSVWNLNKWLKNLRFNTNINKKQMDKQ